MNSSPRQFGPAAPISAAVVVIIAASGWIFAQTANRVSSGGQVNPQVNTALYGGGVPSSVRYADIGSTSRPMNSEVRYAYAKSGALPSEIRGGYASLGPMHPAGPLAYIPDTPSHLAKPNSAPPAPAGSGAYSGASVRYSSPAPAVGSSYIPPRAVGASPVSSSLVSSGPINSTPMNSGAIRYGR